MEKITALFSDWRSKNGADAILPAFLCASVALGGLRGLYGWAVFMLGFCCYLYYRGGIEFKGCGIWSVLGAWFALTLMFSPEPVVGFWRFSRYLVVLAFFSIARDQSQRAGRFWIAVIVGISLVLSVERVIEELRPYTVPGIMGGNPNYGAAFIGSALLGLIALWPENASQRVKQIFWAAALWVGIGLLAANSRGGLAAMFLAVLFLLWLQNKKRIAAGMILAVIALLALAPSEYLVHVTKVDDANSFQRLNMWRTAWNSIALHPLFGAGLGLFGRVFETFKFPFYNGISYYGHGTIHAHSEIINLAAEAGLPAAILFVAGWARGVFWNDRADALGNALKAIVFFLFVQSCVDVTFYNGAVQLLFWGTLGLLAFRSGHEAGNRPLVVVLAIVLIVAAYSELAFQAQKRCALSGKDFERRGKCLEKALSLAPWDTDLVGAAPIIHMRATGSMAVAAAAAALAHQKFPKDPFVLFAQAQAFQGVAPEIAKQIYMEALTLEPGFLSARLELTRILLAQKNTAAAAREARLISAYLKAQTKEPRTVYDKSIAFLDRNALAQIENQIWKSRYSGRSTAQNRKRP